MRPDYKEMRVISKTCRMCEDDIETLDYKDIKMLQRYLSSYGRIEAARRTGFCARHQRKLTTAIKRARIAALLPFTTR